LAVRSSFSETQQKSVVGDSCNGVIAYPAYRAGLTVDATLRPVLLTLQAGPAGASQLTSYTRTTSARQKAACNGNVLGYPRWPDPIQGQVAGMTLDFSSLADLISVHVERRGGTGRPFPIASLVAGRSFSLSTRPFERHQTTVCGAPASCTASLQTWLRLRFTARP
jgi:hypothetical protein